MDRETLYPCLSLLYYLSLYPCLSLSVSLTPFLSPPPSLLPPPTPFLLHAYHFVMPIVKSHFSTSKSQFFCCQLRNEQIVYCPDGYSRVCVAPRMLTALTFVGQERFCVGHSQRLMHRSITHVASFLCHLSDHVHKGTFLRILALCYKFECNGVF